MSSLLHLFIKFSYYKGKFRLIWPLLFLKGLNSMGLWFCLWTWMQSGKIIVFLRVALTASTQTKPDTHGRCELSICAACYAFVNMHPALMTSLWDFQRSSKYMTPGSNQPPHMPFSAPLSLFHLLFPLAFPASLCFSLTLTHTHVWSPVKRLNSRKATESCLSSAR